MPGGDCKNGLHEFLRHLGREGRVCAGLERGLAKFDRVAIGAQIVGALPAAGNMLFELGTDRLRLATRDVVVQKLDEDAAGD